MQTTSVPEVRLISTRSRRMYWLPQLLPAWLDVNAEQPGLARLGNCANVAGSSAAPAARPDVVARRGAALQPNAFANA